MVATKADLFNRLRELDISVTTFEHRPVFTVDQSRSIRGDIDGGHCKNLFLKDKSKKLWLLITLEDAMVDLKNDHERRVNVVLDSNILEHELLNFHPLENTSTTTIRSADLVHFINGCGHSPQILDLHFHE